MDLAFSSGLPLHFRGGFISNRVCPNWDKVTRLSTGKSRAILDAAPVRNIPDEEKNISSGRVLLVNIPEMVDSTMLGESARSYRSEKFAFDSDSVDYDVDDELDVDEDDEDDADDEEDEIEDDLEQIDLEQEEDDPLLVTKNSGLEGFEDEDVELTTMPTSRRKKPRRKPSPLDVTLTGMDIDSNDEAPDEEDDLLEVEPDFLEIQSALKTKPKTIVPGDTEEEPSSSDLLIDEEFDDPSEAELQSAAEMLTGSGLLGRTTIPDDDDDEEVEEEKPRNRKASSADNSKRRKKPKITPLNFDEDEVDSADSVEGGKALGLEGYTDLDEQEEAEFMLTSNTEGSIGRVWELNEDSYITITEPGKTYAYDLDDVESDDQEMTSIRRGSQGGWGSGLQNDAKNKFRKGTPEWIARRSYDLIAKATPREMRLWTKRQGEPPAAINELYPNKPEPQAIIGVAEFNTDSFDGENLPESDDRDGASSLGPGFIGSDNLLSTEDGDENGQSRSALERAVKFPCSFKFKVEGTGGEGLIESLTKDVFRVVNQRLPRSAFAEEPSGRYIRVIFSVEVAEARHVTDLYDAFRQNPLVKFSYG